MVGSAPQFDTVLELCGNKHRRIVLAALTDHQGSVSIDDLVKTIVKYNHHTPLTAVPDETVTRIEISLYHAHIPKLEDAGIVEYDSERQLVEPTAEFDRFESHLSAVLDADPMLATPLEL